MNEEIRNNATTEERAVDEYGAPILSEEEKAERDARRAAQAAAYQDKKQQEQAALARSKRIKLIAALSLAAALLVGGVIWLFCAGTVKLPGGWTYRKIQNGYSIDKYSGSSANVTIPDSFLFRPVTAIDRFAFDDSEMETVVIPDSIVSIDEYAFCGCRNLTSVEIPDSVAYIGYSAFEFCESLNSVKLPESLECIESNLFSDCTSLKEIYVPASVSIIRSYAFAGCESLTCIAVDEANEHFFSHDGMIVSRDGTLVCCPAGKEEITSYPDNLLAIGIGAFSDCGFESITLPNGVTTIEDNAFSSCDELKEVTLPSTVKEIAPTAIRSLNITSINAEGGSYCSVDGILFSGDMTTLVKCPAGYSGSYSIPDSVTVIGDSAFSGCTGLTAVTIPDNVTTIGNDAFNSCSALSNVVIPDSVTEMGSSAFYGCRSLEKVTLSRNLTYISRESFTYCEKLGGIALHEGITSIGYDAFAYNDSLTSITMPKTLESIDTSAFYGCSNLSEVNLNEGLKTIDSGAFGSCGALSELSLPQSLETIGHITFNSCHITVTAPHEASYYQYPIDDGVTWVVE